MDDEMKGESLEDFLGEVSSEELAEADAMMRALSRGHQAEDFDADSYAVAALLQRAELTEDEADAAWKETEVGVRKHLERHAPKVEQSGWFRWWLPAMSVAAAIALLMYAVRVDHFQVATLLPQADAKLLSSQVAVANGSKLSTLDAPMAEHRRNVLASIRKRYEER